MVNRDFSVEKFRDTCQTYVFDVFQILDISDLFSDKVKNDTVENHESTLPVTRSHK